MAKHPHHHQHHHHQDQHHGRHKPTHPRHVRQQLAEHVQGPAALQGSETRLAPSPPQPPVYGPGAEAAHARGAVSPPAMNAPAVELAPAPPAAPNRLFNRRDIRAAREPAELVELPSFHSGELLSELKIISGLLATLAREERAEISELCVTDREPAQQRVSNFPLPGISRYIVRRTGQGGSYTLVANTPLLVTNANEARLGGTIVNSGTTPVTLILTVDLLTPGGGTPLTGGAPQIWLAANGGSWDFRLGSSLWCGNVTALATAPSTVTVAEV